jgi:hypothetical protein
MTNRADECRKLAEKCMALARTAGDPAARATLLTMAQRWYELAQEAPSDLNTILQEFNDQQMQPPKKPDQK